MEAVVSGYNIACILICKLSQGMMYFLVRAFICMGNVHFSGLFVSSNVLYTFDRPDIKHNTQNFCILLVQFPRHNVRFSKVVIFAFSPSLTQSCHS